VSTPPPSAAGGLLRWAREDEVAVLEDLQREASLTGEHRADLLAHPDAVEVPLADLREHRVRVHETDGVVDGYATVLPLPDGDAELDALFVRPARMRRGIGARLVEDAVRRARDGGAGLLVVTAAPAAEAFYARCGFRTVGEAPTRFGPAIRMHRHLGS
jgi:GNAT superfamily N-acetyltransferase